MRRHPFREERWKAAALDLRYFLERGYPRASALRFIGDHYQLHQDERHLLFRGVFTRNVSQSRRRKRVSVRDIKDRGIVIDGHNVLITLESAMKGRPLVLGDDGFVRDISRVFRSFRPTEHTRNAWELVRELLSDYPPSETTVLLDAPLSKSGLLADRIRRWMKDDGITGNAVAVPNLESIMVEMDGIKASADSVIIDRSEPVFDLAGHIIRRRLRLKPLRMP